MAVRTNSAQIVAHRSRTSSTGAKAPQHPCAFLWVGTVSGLGPAQIIVLSDLVRYLQDAGWVLTLRPNGDWVTFRHDAQPVTVLLPQRVTAPGAAALLSGALATLATLAGCSVPTFVAALDTAMEAVKTPSVAVSSAEGDGMGREIS